MCGLICGAILNSGQTINELGTSPDAIGLGQGQSTKLRGHFKARGRLGDSPHVFASEKRPTPNQTGGKATSKRWENLGKRRGAQAWVGANGMRGGREGMPQLVIIMYKSHEMG